MGHLENITETEADILYDSHGFVFYNVKNFYDRYFRAGKELSSKLLQAKCDRRLVTLLQELKLILFILEITVVTIDGQDTFIRMLKGKS